jgi:hypothetical protein
MSGSQMMFLGSTPQIPTFIGYSSATGFNVTTGSSITVPAGTLSTDLMIIGLTSEAGGTFAVPSGFTQLINETIGGGADIMAMFYKLGSVPTTDVTVYGNSALNESGAIVATFRGVSSFNTFGYQSYDTTNNSTFARTSPSIASGTNQLQLFMLFKDTGATTDIMTPSQGTKIAQVDAQTVPDETVICLAWNLGSSATTGTCLWSTSGTVATNYGATAATFS